MENIQSVSGKHPQLKPDQFKIYNSFTIRMPNLCDIIMSNLTFALWTLRPLIALQSIKVLTARHNFGPPEMPHNAGSIAYFHTQAAAVPTKTVHVTTGLFELIQVPDGLRFHSSPTMRFHRHANRFFLPLQSFNTRNGASRYDSVNMNCYTLQFRDSLTNGTLLSPGCLLEVMS